MATTGLLLVGVEVVVVNAGLKIVHNPNANTGAKLRPVLNSERIKISDATVDKDETRPASDIGTQSIVWNDVLGCVIAVMFDNGGNGKVRIWEDCPTPQPIMGMTDAKVAYSRPVTFLQNCGDYVPLYASGRSLSAVLNLGDDGDKLAIKRQAVRYGNADPCALIYTHRLAHVAGLSEGRPEGENSNQERGCSHPGCRRRRAIASCIFHVGTFSGVGVLLAARFGDNYDRDMRVRSFRFLFLAVSAAHVVNYMFKLANP
jgi:hypothetical protein